MIRDIKLTLSVALICYGLHLLSNYHNSYEVSNSKIIKVNEKTEIRIVDGIKHRCTVVDK